MALCRVLKAWHLYTHLHLYGMGKGRRNKVLKLTPAKVKYIIQAKTNNISSKIIAIEMKVSIRTVNRVWGHWLKNKEPLAPKKLGRPKTYLNEADKNLILQVHKVQNCGARRLEQIIEHEYGRHIPHNSIHQVLLDNGLAVENKRKKMRRKPWIRYERKHSLTAVHLDWHTSKFNGKEVCVVLDDSSRFILAGDEFDAATAEASISLVKEALDNFGEIRKIREVITDHGTQFFANKTDKNGESESAFSAFLAENDIKHILARVKHPQTNGKIEKWYHTYEKNRKSFQDFNKLLDWYNSTRYHESLDEKHYLQTPEDAFWSRMPSGCKLNLFISRMERDFNATK
jgi:transposase InsO family protein